MFSSYIRELTWIPGHSFVLRYVLLGSLPVRGSFAVQFGDHFPSGDHLRAGIISRPGIICGPGSFAGLYNSCCISPRISD